MSEREMGRLSNTDINLHHSLYLHYKFYHQDLFAAFKKYATGTLLDIGCGNKPYQQILSEHISQYTGCDIVQSDGDKVDVLCPANAIPLADGSFDTIISTQTVEHVEDHQGLMNEAFRLLKTDGYFIVSGPMYWPLHEEPHDFFRFTKHGFRYILERAGFEVIAIHSNGGKWAVAGQALIHALYPTVYNIKGFKGKVIRMIAGLFGGIKTINRLFAYVDTKVPDYTNTMNYVIVAKKNHTQPSN